MAVRHDFDLLPLSSEVEVRRTRDAEVVELAETARRLVPGVQVGAPELGRYLAFDPDCILSFARSDRLLGGMAFLYLNARGFDALLHGEFCPARPEVRFLSDPEEQASAIYIWAIVLSGRGIAGLGRAAAHLRGPRFIGADCFAQPATPAGRSIMAATGFRPFQSSQPDLWRYQRPWHRPGPLARTIVLQNRSYEDARN